jgi:hypothetical protein
MNRDLNKYEKDYKATPFEETMAGIRKGMLLEFLGKHQFRNVVEVGCAEKSLFESLNDFQSFTVIEPCEAFFAKAQTAARAHKAAPRIQLFQQLFEDFDAKVPMDCIIISSLLHELPTPKAMLEHAYGIAPEGCWLHVNVPNAKSFHRLWAKEAGLIKDEYQRSDTDIRMQRNHTFDLEGLGQLLRDAGFSLVESGSYFIKPFTHAQMQQLIGLGVLSEALMDGLIKMERHLPGLGAEIFVNARK